MNVKEFRQEFKITDYKYDPWSECMSAWFECAAHLWMKGEHVPSEWEYSPGATDNPTEEENYWHEPFKASDSEDLLAIGQLLFRYDRYLRFKGKNY